MIETGLISYKHYMPWIDDLIIAESDVPPWLLDLTVTPFRPNATKIVREAWLSSAGPKALPESWDYAAIGSLYHRYRIGANSWATFLQAVAEMSDSGNVSINCEYFYGYLNVLEDEEFASSTERRQRNEIVRKLQPAIDMITPIFLTLTTYRRRWTSDHCCE